MFFLTCVLVNKCTCQCKVCRSFVFTVRIRPQFLGDIKMQGCNWESVRCLVVFKLFPFFPPPSSLSLFLSVPIKGQWISLPHFHVTSSVFDFSAYLKLAMGLTLSPLISPARNWTCLSCLSDDGPLMGGVHLAGACLDVGLDSCRTQRKERTRTL